MNPDLHPTARLYFALNALNIMLSNTHKFQRLVKTRAEHDEMIRKGRDSLLAVWNADQNRSSGSLEQLFGSIPNELLKPDERSYSYENEAMIESTKSILSNGVACAESAMNALNLGGGDALDLALNPGASVQTIHLRTKLDEATSLFNVMKMTLTISNVSQDSNVQTMVSLASWFRKKTSELSAVIDSDQAKANTNTNVEESTHLCLTNADRTYLAVMYDELCASLGVDLAAKAGYSEYRRPLKKLIKLGLARKGSERGGYVITEKGRTYLRSMRP